MSRTTSEARRPPPRHVDDLPGQARPTGVGTGVVQVLRSDAGPQPAVPTDDEAIMNAKTETVRDGIKWAEGGVPARRPKPPIGVLGFAALGLWVLAVFLGIGAPLIGLEIDARLVVGVLVASGVVSLLSLPVTACTTDAAKKPADRARPDD